MVNIERIEADTTLMLEWIAKQREVNARGRGSGNPKGAQYTISTNNPIFRPLVNMIELIARQHSNKFRISDIWVNYSPPGCINGPHNHVGATIAGCFYLTVPDDSGKIEFETGESIMPNAGDLFYWDAGIIHWVNENESNQDRISIAFNISY